MPRVPRGRWTVPSSGTPAADSTASLIMFTLIAFVVSVTVQEFWRGASARRGRR